jgi:hypothetical protein
MMSAQCGYHEPVGARRVRGGALQPPEIPVEPAKGVESVVAFGPGMVRDLVVADKIGVDDRTADVQVADERLGSQIAGDHRGKGPQERVQAAAAHPRADVVAPLPGCLDEFPADFRDEPGQRAQGVVRVREVSVVALAHPAPPAPGDAHGQDVLRGVAGVEVPARRPRWSPSGPAAASQAGRTPPR